jgi:hypothetical protein
MQQASQSRLGSVHAFSGAPSLFIYKHETCLLQSVSNSARRWDGIVASMPISSDSKPGFRLSGLEVCAISVTILFHIGGCRRDAWDIAGDFNIDSMDSLAALFTI